MINSKISWCHHTTNLWWGCVEAGPECDHCYARELDKMRGPHMDGGKTHWGAKAPRWIRTEKALAELRKISRIAEKTGTVQRVFINSMSDFFEAREDLDEPRKALFEAIPEHPRIRFLLLTKRPANIAKMLPQAWMGHGLIPSNIALGTTVGNKRAVAARAAELVKLAGVAKTLFFSVEPMLENVTTELYNLLSTLGVADRRNAWVIIGGESGPAARLFDAEAARDLVSMCRYGGIKPYVKQLGSRYRFVDGYESPFTPRDPRTDTSQWPESLRFQEIPGPLR